MSSLPRLIREIKNCATCSAALPLGPNPVFSVSKTSKLLIIGQAPGLAVHQTSIPWNDKSGDNLRQWLNIGKPVFYDSSKIAMMPMGFCFPGTGKSGDLPPRTECAPLWHDKILQHLPHIQLTILIGQYAQQHYLKNTAYQTLTETVQNAATYLPAFFPLPHPSPRNNIWMAKNQWFKQDIIPLLQHHISVVFAKDEK